MGYLPYLFGAVLLVLVLLQILPLVRARAMRGKPAPGLTENLLPMQQRTDRMLIYFWSPSCAQCQNMTPVIDELMRSRDDIVKVNAREARDVARSYHVMATPTLVLVQGGRVEKVLVGTKSEKQIRALLNEEQTAKYESMQCYLHLTV